MTNKPTNVMDGESRAKKFWADCEKQSWWKYYNLISGTVNGFLTTIGDAKNSDDIIDNGIDVRDMKIAIAKIAEKIYSQGLQAGRERLPEPFTDATWRERECGCKQYYFEGNWENRIRCDKHQAIVDKEEDSKC